MKRSTRVLLPIGALLGSSIIVTGLACSSAMMRPEATAIPASGTSPADAPTRTRQPVPASVPMQQTASTETRAESTPAKLFAAPLEEAKSGAKDKKKAEAPARDDVAMGDGLAQTGDFEGREASYNAPTRTAEDHLSTFAIDVDTAAYSIARRSLEANTLPNPSLVRVEELINYFHYDYDPPAKVDGTAAGHPFSIQADGARSPIQGSRHLLRVGLQARVVDDADRLPANLVFLVDTSCSMTSEDKLPLAKRALKVAVEHLGAKDKVAITTYAGGVSLVLPPTSADRKDTINAAIDRLASGGGTAMASGLQLAYQQAAKMLGSNSITRIIVCSDGDANIGSTSPDEMLRQVAGYVSEGVTISTIGFGDGNYKDAMMEQIADKGNGNYYYVDTLRQADRIFGRDLTKMLQDVAQDVKIQVDFDPRVVESYRLVGYENRDVADRDFRNDKVDAGEIGAGHQVTALYELSLVDGAKGDLGVVRVRAKEPRGVHAKETELRIPTTIVDRPFVSAPDDLRFATAVMGGAELLRHSPHAAGWTYERVIAIAAESNRGQDPDRDELVRLMRKAAWLTGEPRAVSRR